MMARGGWWGRQRPGTNGCGLVCSSSLNGVSEAWEGQADRPEEDGQDHDHQGGDPQALPGEAGAGRPLCQAQGPYHAQGFQQDAPVQLGLPYHAIFEEDGYLLDAEAMARAA